MGNGASAGEETPSEQLFDLEAKLTKEFLKRFLETP